MSDISKITLPNGSTYDIKDTTARNQITLEAADRKATDERIKFSLEELKSNLTGAMHYAGVTTTALYDRSPVENISSPIEINGEDYIPNPGDVVIYQNKEFVFSTQTKNVDGTEKTIGIWNEFGSTGSLKALAFKDSASGSVTPSGTVSKPIFTGTNSEVTFHTLTSDDSFINTLIDVSNLVASPASYENNEWKYPDINDNYKTNCSLKAIVTGGSVNTTATTTTIKQVSSVGTLPTFSATVDNEILSFNFNAGSLPTTANTSVVTGVSSTHTNPKVEVSPFTIGLSFYDDTITAEVTPQGTVSQPTFTGNASTVTVK